MENGSGAGLPKGSISFVTKTNTTPPVNGGETETPTEPETPEVPEEPKEKRELLYSTPLNHYLTSSSLEFLFSNTSFPGTPLECGVIISSCVNANHTNGSVSFSYTGNNANYSSSFYIPDLIIIKTSYYNSSTECKLSGTTSTTWAYDGENFTMTYNCGAGNLPAPLAPPYTATHNPSTSFGFSAEFYKVTK